MNILAIDIGGSKMMAAQAFMQNGLPQFAGIAHRPLPPDCCQETLLTFIADVVAELGPFDYQRVGITIPGLANPATGQWVYASFSGIRDFPIVEILSRRFGDGPIAIENDVNACALAEKKFGKAQNIDDFLWVTVSNGIGGGLVLGGKIYPGHFGGAAEIGHFGVVDSALDGVPPMLCGCGNVGCLEAEAAGPGMAKRFAKLKERRRGTSFEKDAASAKEISAKEMAVLARQGDGEATAVFETTGNLLGKAVSYAVNLMNLEAVFFGGGVSESFDLFQPAMEKTFRQRLFHRANTSVRLEPSGLGYHAALAGAVAVAIR